jgi:transposase
MKDQETQQRFILMRAQGRSFARLAQDLNVSRGTLINWSRKFRFEIQNLRAIELEALQEQLLATREQRARMLGDELRRVEEELKKRNLADLSTASLHGLARSLRRQIERETGGMEFTSPLKEIPDEEYHEQVQHWTP